MLINIVSHNLCNLWEINIVLIISIISASGRTGVKFVAK